MTKKLPDPHKAALGRPSKYKPEYCEEVVAIMSEGYSLTAVAGRLGVCRYTINNWAAEFPEFFQAVNEGKAARTAKLEEGLLEAPTSPVVTSRIFALKNADPENWRDRHEIAGDKDAPLSINFTTVYEDKPE